MRVLNDFHCGTCDHTQELFVDNLLTVTECQKCGGEATKLTQAVNFELNTSGGGIGYPTAEDKWVKRREKQMAWEKKRSYYEP